MSRPLKPRAPHLSPREVWAHAANRAKRCATEDLLDQQLAALHVRPAEPEYHFDLRRRWRFDRAWPAEKLAVEVEGVTGGAGGRHQRSAGFAADALKYNAAQLDGWTVLRYTQKHVKSGHAVAEIAGALAMRREEE